METTVTPINFQQLVERVSDLFSSKFNNCLFFIDKSKVVIDHVQAFDEDIIEAEKISSDDVFLKNLLMKVLNKKEKFFIKRDNEVYCLYSI